MDYSDFGLWPNWLCSLPECPMFLGIGLFRIIGSWGGVEVLTLWAVGPWAGRMVVGVGIPFFLQSCPETGDDASFREKCPGSSSFLGSSGGQDTCSGVPRGLTLYSGAAFAQGPPGACLYGVIFVFGMALCEEVCCLCTSQLF